MFYGFVKYPTFTLIRNRLPANETIVRDTVNTNFMYLDNESGSIIHGEGTANTELVGQALQAGHLLDTGAMGIKGLKHVIITGNSNIIFLNAIPISNAANLSNIQLLNINTTGILPAGFFGVIVEGSITIPTIDGNITPDPKGSIHTIGVRSTDLTLTGNGRLVLFKQG